MDKDTQENMLRLFRRCCIDLQRYTSGNINDGEGAPEDWLALCMGLAVSVIALNNTERGTMEKIVDGCVWQLEHALNIRDGDMTWQAFTSELKRRERIAKW